MSMRLLFLLIITIILFTIVILQQTVQHRYISKLKIPDWNICVCISSSLSSDTTL